VLARSHVALAVAPYLALLSHPLPPRVAAPVLGLPPGRPVSDPVAVVALSVTVLILAALAPDLDHAGSTPARVAGPVSRAFARGLARLLKHRGPFHSALAALLAGVLAALLGVRLGVTGLGLLVGYRWAAHVLADALTDRGVPLLWPLRRRRVRLPWGPGRPPAAGARRRPTPRARPAAHPGRAAEDAALPHHPARSAEACGGCARRRSILALLWRLASADSPLRLPITARESGGTSGTLGERAETPPDRAGRWGTLGDGARFIRKQQAVGSNPTIGSPVPG
jgi:membrane-bound metal-dependent hydrolase YbcI (DUF457 family)